MERFVLFEKLDLLQLYPDDTSRQARRATRFTAVIANRLGANCFRSSATNLGAGSPFYDIDEAELTQQDISDWAENARNNNRTPIIIRAGLTGDAQSLQTTDASIVSIELEPWQSEETLFAGSGLADLLGDPEREPLVPAGNFGAHTIGYSAFCAVSSLFALQTRFDARDCAIVNGEGVLAWGQLESSARRCAGKGAQTRGHESRVAHSSLQGW